MGLFESSIIILLYINIYIYIIYYIYTVYILYIHYFKLSFGSISNVPNRTWCDLCIFETCPSPPRQAKKHDQTAESRNLGDCVSAWEVSCGKPPTTGNWRHHRVDGVGDGSQTDRLTQPRSAVRTIQVQELFHFWRKEMKPACRCESMSHDF